MGEVITHPINDYELKLTERRKQSASKLNNDTLIYIYEHCDIIYAIGYLHSLQQQNNSYVNVNMTLPADALP